MGPREKLSGGLEDDESSVLTKRQRAPRLPASERRAAIISEAAIFFAEEGFAASTRDLADRLGVRQALLYKYFPSKDALLESIFETVFSNQLSAETASVLNDRSQPLIERICGVYGNFIRERGGIGVRLILRAALDDHALPKRVADAQRTKLIIPLLAELRHESGLVPLTEQPLLVGEFELAMMLHGAVVFNQMRAHVFRVFPIEHMPDAIRLYVATFLDGARDQMRHLHANAGKSPLAAAAE